MFSHAYAQKRGQELADSLVAALPKVKVDSVKAKVLYKLAVTMSMTSNYDEGIKYGKQYLEVTKNTDKEVKGYHVLGILYARKSDFPTALENFLEALKMYEAQGNKHGIEAVTGNIGNIYENEGKYKESLEYHMKALKIAEELGDKDAISRDLNNVGNSYAFLGDHEKELEYYLKSLKINEEMGDTSSMAQCNVNIGTAYEEQRKHSQALEYLFRGLRLGEVANDGYAVAKAMGNIGSTFLTFAMIPDAGAGKTSYSALSKTQLLAQAHLYIDSAIMINKEAGDLHGLIECYNNLYRTDSMQGDFKGALNAHLQYMTYRDSVYNTDNNIKINKLETKRALELKDKQIEIDRLAVEKKRNERVFYIIGIGLLVMVIIIVVRNLIVQKRSNVMLSKEKKRSEDLLLNILPSEVAEELKEKGIADARHFDNVTVLFTDFVNFTQAGERMSPKQLVDELHNCFKTFDGILGKYNIEKIKTVGDAYLAVSGLPVANTKHAEDIVAAAVEIRDFMIQRKREIGDSTFEMRIGVHTGSVVAGIVGVKKFAYDIWGDTVNTAARMEQNSEAGKINISETTYSLVSDKFKCTYRGEIDAKNKGQLKMYFVE